MRSTDQDTELGLRGPQTSTAGSSLPAQARTVRSHDPQTQGCCHRCIHRRSLFTEHLDAQRCATGGIGHHGTLVENLGGERGLGGDSRSPLLP